ncbi:hypothetical protein GL305_35055 [Nocardia seriolae]|uniref:hypothetical protein n=1 Tax=Nocardia seriolae TaxID=37332 RepID=UPI0011AB3425|nr:hypothetical protein [Nocardia seriolae]MTJ60817.1 hypothetical protein [Nocardia seriolae]MTJ91040.1 hypothetical protein [Nocardia seriolae]MTK35002.1 hypothetical protein [Nocardia seriolae]MTK51618.1 hypothetical protein [Nocardia seriolae]
MSEEAITKIRARFDELVRRGFDPHAVEGADDGEIDTMAADQNAPAVPAAVREVLRLIGRDPGRFESAGGQGYRAIGVRAINAEQRQLAQNFAEYDSPAQRFRTPARRICARDGRRLVLRGDRWIASA